MESSNLSNNNNPDVSLPNHLKILTSIGEKMSECVNEMGGSIFKENENMNYRNHPIITTTCHEIMNLWSQLNQEVDSVKILNFDSESKDEVGSEEEKKKMVLDFDLRQMIESSFFVDQETTTSNEEREEGESITKRHHDRHSRLGNFVTFVSCWGVGWLISFWFLFNSFICHISSQHLLHQIFSNNGPHSSNNHHQWASPSEILKISTSLLIPHSFVQNLSNSCLLEIGIENLLLKNDDQQTEFSRLDTPHQFTSIFQSCSSVFQPFINFYFEEFIREISFSWIEPLLFVSRSIAYFFILFQQHNQLSQLKDNQNDKESQEEEEEKEKQSFKISFLLPMLNLEKGMSRFWSCFERIENWNTHNKSSRKKKVPFSAKLRQSTILVVQSYVKKESNLGDFDVSALSLEGQIVEKFTEKQKELMNEKSSQQYRSWRAKCSSSNLLRNVQDIEDFMNEMRNSIIMFDDISKLKCLRMNEKLIENLYQLFSIFKSQSPSNMIIKSHILEGYTLNSSSLNNNNMEEYQDRLEIFYQAIQLKNENFYSSSCHFFSSLLEFYKKDQENILDVHNQFLKCLIYWNLSSNLFKLKKFLPSQQFCISSIDLLFVELISRKNPPNVIFQSHLLSLVSSQFCLLISISCKLYQFSFGCYLFHKLSEICQKWSSSQSINGDWLIQFNLINNDRVLENQQHEEKQKNEDDDDELITIEICLNPLSFDSQDTENGDLFSISSLPNFTSQSSSNNELEEKLELFKRRFVQQYNKYN